MQSLTLKFASQDTFWNVRVVPVSNRFLVYRLKHSADYSTYLKKIFEKPIYTYVLIINITKHNIN